MFTSRKKALLMQLPCKAMIICKTIAAKEVYKPLLNLVHRTGYVITFVYSLPECFITKETCILSFIFIGIFLEWKVLIVYP